MTDMTDRRYGGFWRRLVAYAIDKIILYLISLFLLLTGLFALGRGGISLGRIVATGDLPRGMGFFAVAYLVAMFITDMIYFTWFHGSVGQTPGKMILGLRVVTAPGAKMTFGVAFLRWVGALISGLFLSLGYLWIAFDGKKQGWHDKIAVTLVTRTATEPDPASPPPFLPLAEAAGQTPAVGAPAPAHPPQGSEAANPPAPPSPSSDAGAGAASPPGGDDLTGSVNRTKGEHPGQG
jgi:uncharacterized RDD family membrane protein YckC